MNTNLKYGKKDGITGIASGKYGIKHPKESRMTGIEIDMMLQESHYVAKTRCITFNRLTSQGGKVR